MIAFFININILYNGDQMKINHIYELIGNTPLIKIDSLSSEYNCNIYLKLEKYNFSGSIKDRAVMNMLIKAFEDKKINDNTTIIEATSGNTGIALASICARLKIKCIIVLPSDSNEERVNLLKLLNAKVIFTPSKEKMKGCIKKVIELLSTIENSYSLFQFENINNEMAHYTYTANEIISELPDIDGVFLTGGTYATLKGISKRLKEFNDKINVVEVRPSTKKHRICGVFSNTVNDNVSKKYIDKVVRIEDLYSINMVKKIASQEGLLIGLSSGLAISGAIKYIKDNKLNNIVIVCPDGIERYISNNFLFNEKYNIEYDLKYIKEIMFTKKDFYLDDIFIKYGIYESEAKNIKNKLVLDCIAIQKMDPAVINKKQIINDYTSFFAIFVYRIAHVLTLHKKDILARKMSEYAHSVTGIDIHPKAIIGKSFAIDHGCGVVIGETCKIGNNVRIYQGVTLGAKSLSKSNVIKNKKRHPTIKNNVIIYAGAYILGGNTIIGNNVIIGSNVFITNSIKDNVIVSLSNKNYILKER